MHKFDEFTARLTDLVMQYTRDRLALDPVPLDSTRSRSELAAVAGGLITETGNDPERVLRVFAEEIAPAVISCDSPRFLSFIPAAPTKASLLFDMVVSASSLSGISWLDGAGAIFAENETLAFLANEAGLPDCAGGCFVSGGSAGNLSALVVAREIAKRRDNAGVTRWRFAVSDQAHSSITNTARILECDTLAVDTDDGRMTGDALRRAIDRDGNPASIAGVVATAGTTNAGIIDDLATTAKVAEELGCWMHVDGAYGGAGLLASSVRERYAGIEHADSLVVDPHKWLFAPFDCCALIYREPALARSVHTQHASYLDVIHNAADDSDAVDEWNPTDYAYHLSRRARGLPLWFSLAVHGAAAYRDAVEAGLALARAAANRVRNEPHLELLREPDLSVVLFRRIGWGPEQYQEWSEALLRDQIAFVTPTKWRGETVARFAFLHPSTTINLVDEILATME